MYSSYFMQTSRLSRYVRTLWNYIFMGTEFGKGGPILAAKIGPGGPFLAADRFFRYRPTETKGALILYYPVSILLIHVSPVLFTQMI